MLFSIKRFLVVAGLFFMANAALAANKWKTNTEVFFAGGDSRSYYGIANLFPWSQDGKSMIYSDVRYMSSDASAEEVNIGAGYRKFNDSETAIYGFFAAVDHRVAPSKKRYNQVTIGAEYLSSGFDLRLNGYVPITEKYTILQANKEYEKSYETKFIGNRFVKTETKKYNSTLYEEALSGVDAEIGHTLGGRYAPYEVRAYMGGYYFTGDVVGDTVGTRFRIEARPVRAFVLNLKVENDPLYKSRGLMELRWLFGKDLEDYSKRSLSDRMIEFAVRDIDIKETSQIEHAKRSKNDGRVDVVTESMHSRYSKIVHINKDYSGGGSDGTFEKPFTSFEDCINSNACSNNKIIYVHAKNATTMYDTKGLVLEDDQYLIGDGSNFKSSYNEFWSLASGSSPILHSSNAALPVLTLTKSNNVFGLKFGTQDDAVSWQKSSAAIKVTGRDNKIEQVYIVGSNTDNNKQFERGIYFAGIGNTSSNRLRDVTIANTSGENLLFETVNNTANSTVKQSLHMQSTFLKTGKTGLSIIATGNTASASIEQYITWDESFAERSSYSRGSNVEDHREYGINVDSSGDAKVEQKLYLDRVMISKNKKAGIRFNGKGTIPGRTAILSVRNSFITANEGGGIHYLNTGGSSKVQVEWSNIYYNIKKPTTAVADAGKASGYGIYMEGVQTNGGEKVNQTLNLVDIEKPEKGKVKNYFFNFKKPVIAAHGAKKAQIYIDSSGNQTANKQIIRIDSNYATGIGGNNSDLGQYSADRLQAPVADDCVAQIGISASASGANTEQVKNTGPGSYIRIISPHPTSSCQ